jgi:hypothetical protein
MNRFITSYNKGEPIVLNDIRWALGSEEYLDAGIIQAIEGILLNWGTDFIVQGCTPSGAPGNITEGWIMLNSELIKVDAHAGTNNFYAKVVTYDSDGSKTFQDGTVNDTYEKTRATSSAGSGTLQYNGDRFEDVILANLSAATTSLAGKIAIASISEVNTGTNNTEAVTPLGLHSQTTWSTVTLLNNWGGSLKYRKNNLGQIEFDGAPQKTASTSSAVIGVLSAGHRPTTGVVFGAIAGNAGGGSAGEPVFIEIDSSGNIRCYPYATITNNNTIFMDGLRFSTDM